MIDIPETTQETRTPLHGAILSISLHRFADMLNLPNDVNISAVYNDPTTGALILHLVGDSLPEIGLSCQPRQADVSVEQKRDDEGVWWRRLKFFLYAN